MEQVIQILTNLGAAAGGKLILALLVFIIGKIVIKRLMKFAEKSRVLAKVEATVRTFTLSFVKIGLWVILIISIISILGVPMASVVAVLASAGVAVGLALQGALSNVAGGIMLMIFKPFRVGDYVDAAGVQGTVTEVTIVYTVLLTVDNKKVTIPNGSLMNANVINYSSEATRRVDLSFSCRKDEDPVKVQNLILQTMKENKMVLLEPAPFARVNGGNGEAMSFDARVWVNNADYWDVYYDLTQAILERFREEGIQAPAVRVITEKVSEKA